MFLGEFEQQHGYEHEHEQLVIPSLAKDLTVACNYRIFLRFIAVSAARNDDIGDVRFELCERLV